MEKILTLQIDGRKIEAKEGMAILEVAREVGIEIPTLCYHEKLVPFGACRLCSVEVEREGRISIVASCGYLVEDALVVKTHTPRVEKFRKTIVELVAPSVGEVLGELRILADKYKADVDRFRPNFDIEPGRCILCGLCVRYCDEVVGINAIDFVGRGTKREVVFFTERARGACVGCQECFYLCPTGKIPAWTDGSTFYGFSLKDYLK